MPPQIALQIWALWTLTTALLLPVEQMRKLRGKGDKELTKVTQLVSPWVNSAPRSTGPRVHVLNQPTSAAQPHVQMLAISFHGCFLLTATPLAFPPLSSYSNSHFHHLVSGGNFSVQPTHHIQASTLPVPSPAHSVVLSTLCLVNAFLVSSEPKGSQLFYKDIPDQEENFSL